MTEYEKTKIGIQKIDSWSQNTMKLIAELAEQHGFTVPRDDPNKHEIISSMRRLLAEKLVEEALR